MVRTRTSVLAVLLVAVAATSSRDEALKAFSLFARNSEAKGITFSDLRALADELDEDFTDQKLQEMVIMVDYNGHRNFAGCGP